MNWPARLRDGELRPGDWRETDQKFHAYAQWIAQQQVDLILRSNRRTGVKWYLDLPVGVNTASYDLWAHRECFAPAVGVGAPPDMFFAKGQNWGFVPLHPQRVRDSGYRYVIDYLRFQMAHTGLLRIDHVMGLQRLYCIPAGFSGDKGAYLRYAADEFYAILSLESHRHKTMIVGENLGIVPPETTAAMRRTGSGKCTWFSSSNGRMPPRRCERRLFYPWRV